MTETDISSRKLVATVGNRRFPVTSWQQVSDAYTAAIDALDIGASKTPPCLIINRKGRVIAHVSFNGRVWEGTPQDWHPRMTPLCHPSMGVSA